MRYRYGELSLKSARTNLQGTHAHPDIVDEYMHTEITQSWIADFFPLNSLPRYHINMFWFIPKGHQINK